MMATRREKVSTLEDAVGLVESGCSIALGGYWYHNQPSAFARALVRHGTCSSLVVTGSPVGGYAQDLLLATGLVRRLRAPHVSFDELGLSPGLRIAAATGATVVEDLDEAVLVGALRAANTALPAMPVRGVCATGIVHGSELVRASAGQLAPNEMVAFAPDVAVIHVSVADRYGNAVHGGPPFADRLLARSARRVILTAERLVDNEEIRREPRLTTIPGVFVDAVVELPRGAHPCSCHGDYEADVQELSSYVAAGDARRRGEPAKWERYLREKVAVSHDDYLRAMGIGDGA